MVELKTIMCDVCQTVTTTNKVMIRSANRMKMLDVCDACSATSTLADLKALVPVSIANIVQNTTVTVTPIISVISSPVKQLG